MKYSKNIMALQNIQIYAQSFKLPSVRRTWRTRKKCDKAPINAKFLNVDMQQYIISKFHHLVMELDIQIVAYHLGKV